MTAATVKRIGLVGGPVLGLLCYWLLPPQYATVSGGWKEFTQAGRATLAVMVWMAGWWLTEATDIEATALLPIVTFPLLGIAPLGAVLPPYAADVIFLFMGGFIIGLAIELGPRPAHGLLHTAPGRAPAGGDRRRLHGRHRVLEHVGLQYRVHGHDGADRPQRRRPGRAQPDRGRLEGIRGIPEGNVPERNFAVGLLLCVANAASIGGVATIIGSPPNGIAVRYVQQTFGKEVSFVDWLLLGGPFTLVFLPIAWLLVTRVLFRADIGEIAGGRQHFDEEYRKLGSFTRGETIVLAVFAVTAFLWIFSPLLKGLSIGGVAPLAGLSDAGIAMLAATALFLIPVDRAQGTRAMDWATARRLLSDLLDSRRPFHARFPSQNRAPDRGDTPRPRGPPVATARPTRPGLFGPGPGPPGPLTSRRHQRRIAAQAARPRGDAVKVGAGTRPSALEIPIPPSRSPTRCDSTKVIVCSASKARSFSSSAARSATTTTLPLDSVCRVWREGMTPPFFGAWPTGTWREN
jgi:hypothetical protein